MLLDLPARVDQDDLDVAAELPQDLAAGAAGRGQRVRVGSDGDAAELTDAFADGLENGDALGADGEAVGRVFDVATGVDAAVGVFQGGAYLEFRVGGEGVGARGKGCLQELGAWGFHSTSLGSSAFNRRTRVSRTIAPVSRTFPGWIFVPGRPPAARW